jgi:hypothetical protein
MTSDQFETRLLRLESQAQATDALLHAVLPAIDPARRPVVMRQFAQYCRAREARLQGDAGAPEVQVHLQVLGEAYTRLEGALQLIEAHERKKAKKS